MLAATHMEFQTSAFFLAVIRYVSFLWDLSPAANLHFQAPPQFLRDVFLAITFYNGIAG